MISAKVVADSISQGVRLTTMEVVTPRFILAELNTHRQFSRNSASSRAIPVKNRIDQVRNNPFVPLSFGKNKSGMQADEALAEEEQLQSKMDWLDVSNYCAAKALAMSERKVHKQHANRLLETFAWHTVLVTATEWSNFFNLRRHPDAQPEMQDTAHAMFDAMQASTPKELKPGEWHIPYFTEEDFDLIANDYDGGQTQDLLVRLSVARCAALSYERQVAKKAAQELIGRHDALLKSGHMSPFEHQAQAVEDPSKDYNFSPVYKKDEKGDFILIDGLPVIDYYMCGNFRAPWKQYRKTIPGEAIFQG